MSSGVAEETALPQKKMLQSVGAIAAGFVVNIALSLGTDAGLHAMGLTPALGQPMTNGQLMLAAVYRTIYAVFSSYIVARLAPQRPMKHALVGGAIGMGFAIAGAAATWNFGLGPHWYPLALIAVALPTAWAGGKLRVLQIG